MQLVNLILPDLMVRLRRDMVFVVTFTLTLFSPPTQCARIQYILVSLRSYSRTEASAALNSAE